MPSIEYSGKRIEYCIERKKIKHVNLRITAEGAVKVSAPRRVSNAFIQAFVEEKADWIWRRLKQKEQILCNLKARPEAKDGAPLWLLGKPFSLMLATQGRGLSIGTDTCILAVKDKGEEKKNQAMLNTALRGLYQTICRQRLQAVYPAFQPFDIPYPTLKLRNMKRCWGTCQVQTAVITMNPKLVHAPLSCTDYILAHELSHLVEPNHSAAFYRVLQQVYPDWRAQRALLSEQHIL